MQYRQVYNRAVSSSTTGEEHDKKCKSWKVLQCKMSQRSPADILILYSGNSSEVNLEKPSVWQPTYKFGGRTDSIGYPSMSFHCVWQGLTALALAAHTWKTACPQNDALPWAGRRGGTASASRLVRGVACANEKQSTTLSLWPRSEKGRRVVPRMHVNRPYF